MDLLLVDSGREVSRALAQTAREAGDAESLRTAAARLESIAGSLAGRDVDRPFRVVLMGRTMAGKSTLFEYLSGGDGSRIGDGGQRTSRDSCARPASGLDNARPASGLDNAQPTDGPDNAQPASGPDNAQPADGLDNAQPADGPDDTRPASGRRVELVDTPGVGAMDGREDYEVAFGQVADADLILWVATTQATQEQTGRALERLADLGKPILVALNCLADLTDEINLMDMLEEPERVFGGDAEGNLAPIRRHLLRAGGRYLDAIPVHAQAAGLARSGGLDAGEARTLHANSRIDDLIGALAEQADRTGGQRRAVSVCDALRVALLDAAGAVAEAHATASAAHTASLGMQLEFRNRAVRRVDDAYAELTAAFATAIAARERWAETVDVDRDTDELNRRLDQEIATLRTELEQAAADAGQRLEADLQGIAIDVAEDWTGLTVDGFRDLGGRGTVWGNRAVKTGGRLAAGFGGLALGAKLGAWAGTPLGPVVGNVIGMVAGGLIGFVASVLGADKLIDRLGDSVFRSAAEVRRRRRRMVREQMAELLGRIRKDLEPAGERVRQVWLDAVEHEVARQYEAGAALERSAAALRRVSADTIEPVITRIDTELGRELLRHTGRDRIAAAVVRASRWRGAGIAVELPEPEFTELARSPAAGCVERMVPTRAPATAGDGALQIIRHLADRAVTVLETGPDHLLVSLDAPVDPGVWESWHALTRVHTGIDVRLEGALP